MEKDRWLDTFLHLQESRQEVSNRFQIFLDLGIKVRILSLDIAQTPINPTKVINLEETNPFQVSVREIIDQLEESILENQLLEASVKG